MPLLNCCVYDGHNEFLKERATLAIKFVMDGSEEAQKFVRELVPVTQGQNQNASAVTVPSQTPKPTLALATSASTSQTSSQAKTQVSAPVNSQPEDKDKVTSNAEEATKTSQKLEDGKKLLAESKDILAELSLLASVKKGNLTQDEVVGKLTEAAEKLKVIGERV